MKPEGVRRERSHLTVGRWQTGAPGNQLSRDHRHIIQGRPCVRSSQQRKGACAMTMTKMFALMGLVVVISLSPVIIGLIYVLV
jgi:hypothetical protein